MTPYRVDIAQSTMELAKSHGFDEAAVVVPSAVGLPVSTGLSPDDYDAAVTELLSASKKARVEKSSASR